MEFLLIIGLICFSIIAIFRLDWAIFIILTALPAYLLRFKVGFIPTTMLEAMIVILFLSWFLQDKPWQRLKKHDWQNRRQKYPYHLEIIGILVAAWLGAAVAGFDNAALGILKAYFLEPIMLYLVIINRGKKSENRFIWPLALSATVISAIAIFQQLTGLFIFNVFWAQASQRRITSIFAYPNAVGLYLGPIIFLLAGLFLSYPKRSNLITASKKIFLLLIIVASLAAIIFARSEGAWVGLLGGTFLVALLSHRRIRGLTIGLTIIGLIFLACYAPAWQYIQ